MLAATLLTVLQNVEAETALRTFRVSGSFRQETEGVPDNRTFPEWTLDDLAAQTVEDRRAFYLKHHPEVAQDWTDHEDRGFNVTTPDGRHAREGR